MQYLMLMGTGSNVGKSLLATALCRIFAREGQKVAPFKAQNMALNSCVTPDGAEIGRAQGTQAEAAGILPTAAMNPVLLKPTGNSSSQVIIMGKPVGNMSAREYHAGYSLKAFDAVKDALAILQKEYNTLVIEGAGSPAEVNLKDHDIVNMRVAKYLDAPVLLVADIDRGGALAAVVGTLELLDDDERELVKGIIINKFRGDVSLFTPAVEFLEQRTGKPVVGIVEYMDNHGIDDEDSVALDNKSHTASDDAKINIAVLRLPKIANFTDFDALASERDVNLVYVEKTQELDQADAIIIPGSKNTMDDLLYLKNHGFADKLQSLAKAGKPIAAICGGYQMAGERIEDPTHSESAAIDAIDGLKLLPARTVFAKEKLTAQITADTVELSFLGKKIRTKNLTGYEIHMGKTVVDTPQPFVITSRRGQPCRECEGAAAGDNVFGTYIHGLFDNDDFRRDFLNALRENKGLPPLYDRRNRRREREAAFDKLADFVAKALDMEKIRSFMLTSALTAQMPSHTSPRKNKKC